MSSKRKYTDQQRGAISNLINQQGMTASAAVTRAAEGTIQGVEAFEIPEATARHIAAEAERQSTTRDLAASEIETPGALTQLRDRALRILGEELDGIEQEQRDGEEIDLERLRQVSRSLRELQRLSSAIPRAVRTNDGDGTDQPSEIVQRLLAEHRLANGSQ